MSDLRKSTVQNFILGPFIDETDFVTPLGGLTISATDIKLSKNGSNELNSQVTQVIHNGNGEYKVTCSIFDVDSAGTLDINCKMSGALIVADRFSILHQAQYDFKYGDKAPATQESVDAIFNALGLANVKSIDGSTADLVSMILKIFDDNNGDDFDSSTDSLNKLAEIAGAGSVELKTADADVVTGAVVSGQLSDTYVQDGVSYITRPDNNSPLQHQFDFVCGVDRLGVIIEVFGRHESGFAIPNPFVKLQAYSWIDNQYKDVSNESNHMYRSSTLQRYSYVIDAQFSRQSDGLVRLNFVSSTDDESRELVLDYLAVKHLNIVDTTPTDFAIAVWDYPARQNGKVGLNTMGGYLATTCVKQFKILNVTDSKTFQIEGTFQNNCYNGYPIIISDSQNLLIYSAIIETIDSVGNVVLRSNLPFTPNTEDVIQVNNKGELNSDSKLSKDLAITVDLGSGISLQANLIDIYNKAGSGSGGDGIKWTDIVNGRTLLKAIEEISSRTVGRINRIDNGDGTFTLQFFKADNALSYQKKVSDNERLDS